ncbi:hypothetical protein AMTRI_Chr02g222040 [Amborella trichopoda]|uniref:bidirectional sugar transporter SWEET14 n=1 Tax=Amborella trichopoda TaxID=13333 RepID=UPI0005D3AB11|nr:bidirectional sugar transporter SWEET14 [Amborella trichopoda]|eukprot:XP_011627469.1 bidirectional sugar transporter SWEET14 [Amborella trichopoda]
MAVITVHHPLTFAFGLLGNIIGIMVYLAPLPTFYRVYKKKSTEGFKSLPYVVALFSAMLWLYYSLLKIDAYLLITINSVGCVIELMYIAMFLAYAPKKAKMLTATLLLLLNVVVFAVIVLFTFLFAKDSKRVGILGWICASFSVSVFAAPLSVMRSVIRTKSVEFMPFYLSLFLTLSAVTWFTYGLCLKDYFVALPNVLGFLFGIIQMFLHAKYGHAKNVIVIDENLPEKHIDIVKLGAPTNPEVHPIVSPPPSDEGTCKPSEAIACDV